MAAKKKFQPNDIEGAAGAKAIKDRQWREFSAWINGKDARGGKEAQVALAKSRATQLMRDFGPKKKLPAVSIRQAENKAASAPRKVATTRQADRVSPAPRKATPKPAKRSGSSTGIRKAGPQVPKSGPYSRF